MATTPPIASGVSITTAGAGGMLTGDAGLAGLFTALMGDAAPVGMDGAVGGVPEGVPAGEGMISVLLGVRAGDDKGVDAETALKMGSLNSLFAAQHATVQTEVKLGDAPALTVSGDEEAVAAFVAQVQEVFKQITQDGKLTMGQLRDARELAQALTGLGMAPEEAMGVAERIQTMLRLLEQQQEVDDETAGSLIAMMLAIMGQGDQQPAPVAAGGKDSEALPLMGLQIISVEQAVAQASSAKVTAWQMRIGGDVTRDLLGLNDAGRDREQAAPAEMVKTFEVVLKTEAEASVGVAIPEIKPQAVKEMPIDAKPSDAAQAVAMASGAGVKVQADEKIEAPKGDTYYRLQADRNGVETLEAVKPVGELREAATAAMQGPSQPAHVAAAASANAAASEAAAFAEHAARVEQISQMVEKAQVGKQVAVQIQPLLEQGGGTVRMNLHPHQLGQVTVELQVVDGKVQGSIAATEPAVVEQLARELHTLRHGLADAGLKLGDQGINLMLSQRDQQGGHQDHQGQSGNHRQAQGGTGGSSEGETGLTANLAGWIAPDRVLDVNV